MTQEFRVAFKSAMLAGVAGVALTSTGWAQTSPGSGANTPQTTSANGAAPTQSQTQETITVTGSRIVLNGYSAPTNVSPSADLPMPARGQLYMALGDGVENWRPPDDLANSQ